MKLKINLFTILMLSLFSLLPFAVTADEPTVDPKTETPLDMLLRDFNNNGQFFSRPATYAIGPLEIFKIIDDYLADQPPMSPEEIERWKRFTQSLADIDWRKKGVQIRFSLDENGQLMCWYSLIHVPLVCTETATRMVSSIQKAKEQGTLTTYIMPEKQQVPTNQQVKDFISQELKDKNTAEQMVASIEQFMKESGLNTLAFDILIKPRQTVNLKANNMGNVTSLDMNVVFPQDTEQSLFDYNGEVNIRGTIETTLPCLEGQKRFSCNAQLAFGNITAYHCTINDHNIDLRIFVKQGEQLEESYSIAGIEVYADQACFQ